MPNRPSDQASRAEARRRARLAAQGRETEWENAEDRDETETGTGGPAQPTNWLQRVIPPAPPLRGKPDPLATFRYEGPLRPIVEALYLLARNPVAWLIPGLLWLAVSVLPMGDATLQLVGQLVTYGALIAAGWIGWQRPWLFGLAAALLGWLPVVVYLFILFFGDPAQLANAAGRVPTADELVGALGVRTLLQTVLGLVAGWYGGYLRRRLADQRPAPDRGSRRR
jgi:hypothetical protein